MKSTVAIGGGQFDMFCPRIDQFITDKHELVVLAGKIDWDRLEIACGASCSYGPGQPPLSFRLMAGLHILKFTFNYSDERVISEYVRDPYFQYFCGEEFFQHVSPLDRSSLTRWRQRMGEEKVMELLRETLDVAIRTGAAKPSDFSRVVVDTTVQPKNIAWPTDAKLIFKALGRLTRQAKAAKVPLRQSYARLSQVALKRHQAYAHGKNFKHADEQLELLKTYLGTIIREIGRKIKDNGDLKQAFSEPLRIAERVMTQRPRDGEGRHVYSVHAPEALCIVKGKARRPCEFGSKVSVATPVRRCKGGQLVAHIQVVAGNTYDGKTLETVLWDIEGFTGVPLGRVLADRGYRGDYAPQEYKGIVFLAGQKDNIPACVKKELRRRNAIEPVIGHVKNEHRMDRNYLAHEQGDAINAVLAAVGYNFSLLLKWIRLRLKLGLNFFLFLWRLFQFRVHKMA